MLRPIHRLLEEQRSRVSLHLQDVIHDLDSSPEVYPDAVPLDEIVLRFRRPGRHESRGLRVTGKDP